MSTGFIFARLFHVFFEEPAYYLEDFSRVLDVWSGGFVWYGGVVFGTLSGVLLMRWRKEPIARWLDLFAPIGALGYALGRFACLFVGCCYGKTFVWNEHIIRHPTQLYSIVLELLALAYLLRVEKSGRLREGELILRWVIIHGINRLVIEQFRGDPRGPELLGLSIATWISSALILSAGAVTFLGYRPEKKRPA